MDPSEVKERIEAMAINCDLLAHCCDEIIRLSGELGMTGMNMKMAAVTPGAFRAIAEHCREQAEGL